ncbi:MAG TPA: diacylglycerol kinase [Gammaproteobacteria bacterium]|nr:diacylglycerol kinase [Gammaproteobacteria bacterium]
MAEPSNVPPAETVPLPRTGLRRVAKAAAYSLAGLRSAWKHEAAFRQECALAAFLIPAGVWLGQSAAERALLIGSCLLVLVVELLNSAVEAVVDRIGPDYHSLSARAKDLGSAAVFVSLLLAVVVFGLVAWQRFAG